jgi:Tol biopolymer transport system component
MAAFSPDGESIAFRSERDGGGIFVMGRTGESVRRVATRGFTPAWFPDGLRLVFAGNGTPGPESISTVESDLSLVDVAGGEARTLVAGYYATQPRVSPHGLRMAFWAVRSDLKTDRYNRDIWTVDINGGNPQRATTDPANDWNPVWSPDGRWLYFISNRSGSMNLWRVAIDESSGRTSGEPQPITAPAPYVAHFSLSADGRTATYAAVLNTGNMAHVGFDSRTGTVVGKVTAITTGARDSSAGISMSRAMAASSPRRRSAARRTCISSRRQTARSVS